MADDEVDPKDGSGLDDDALADALAADLDRLATGAIQIIRPLPFDEADLFEEEERSEAPAAEPAVEAEPSPAAEVSTPEPEAEPEPAATPEPEPAADVSAPEPEPATDLEANRAQEPEPATELEADPASEPEPESAPEPEPASEFDPAPEPAAPDNESEAPLFSSPEPDLFGGDGERPSPPSPFAPDAPAAPPISSAPAWSLLPPPDPSQAVPLEDGPPTRRSLPDDKLAEWVDTAGQEPGSTLEIIEQLETQVRLRDEEVREFTAWEDRMRSLGTPDALAAVADARTEFVDVLPDATPAAPVASVPENLAPEPVAPEAEPDAEPVAAVEQEPPIVVSEVPDFAISEPTDDENRVDDDEGDVEASEDVAATDVAAEAAHATDAEAEAEAENVEAEEAESGDAGAEVVTAEDAEIEDTEAEFSEGGEVDFSEDARVEVVEPEVTEPEVTAPDVTEPDVTEVDVTEVELDEPAASEFAEAEPGVVEPADEPFVQDPDEPFLEPTLTDGPRSELDSPQDSQAPQDSDEPQHQDEPQDPDEPQHPDEPQDPDTPQDPDEPEPEPLIPPLIDPPPLGTPPFGTPPASPPAPSTPAFSFDALLIGDNAAAPETTVPDDDAEEPPLHPDAEPLDAPAEPLFIEPVPFAVGELLPSDTGSITVIDQAYEEDLDDDVDETDRVPEGFGTVAVDPAGVALVAPQPFPPSGPISTTRIPQDESVFFDDEPVKMKVFSLETTGLEATPVDHRVGRAARMFWLWFATNSSILSLGLGAAVFAVGMSLRQSIVAIVAGVALSFIPLGLTTLAGKRSGQPTMVVSRATFGLLGNVVPAALALLTRVFWGAVLLWLLGSSISVVLVGAELGGPLGERGLLLASLAGAFLVALLVAFAGYPLFARLQLILSIISGILVVGLFVLTAEYVDIPTALTTPDGPWLLTLSGAVLVFSFVGLVWAHSGADLARYQRVGSSGASSMLWATFGSTLPTFLLIAYGALLAASDTAIARGFLASPLDTLATMLPLWYPAPLVAAAALSLLSGITLSIYSGGFALQSLGVRLTRQWSVVIVGVLLAALTLVLSFGVTGGINELFRDAATTLAVPTAAWAGIFAAETIIRNRRYESQSLLKRGGVYADVRWLNLIALVVITVVGYGLTSATISWLSWQGYGFSLVGVAVDSDLAATDVGVLIALGLGLLVPVIAGIPAIRKQEAARL